MRAFGAAFISAAPMSTAMARWRVGQAVLRDFDAGSRSR